MIRNIEAHESSQCNKKRGEKRLPINKTFLSKKKMPPEKRNNNNNTNNKMYKLETCSETFKLMKALNAKKKLKKKKNNKRRIETKKGYMKLSILCGKRAD
jgi:hypothetical protein